MMTRRAWMVAVAMSVMGAACTAPRAPQEEVKYTGALPAGPITGHANHGACPSCAYTTEGTIRGTLKAGESFGEGLFPLQWMYADYKLNGVIQSSEQIDIDDGSINVELDHPVGATSFDAIFLRWLDAEDQQGTSDESIPFES